MWRKKKVCPFFLLENSRPLSPWGPLDSLSTCLGNDSLKIESVTEECKEEIQVLALKNGIFLYYSSFASQTIMRELHIYLYLHLYFSSSSLVEFQGRRRESLPFSWPQRCYRREEKEKEANCV